MSGIEKRIMEQTEGMSCWNVVVDKLSDSLAWLDEIIIYSTDDIIFAGLNVPCKA